MDITAVITIPRFTTIGKHLLNNYYTLNSIPVVLHILIWFLILIAVGIIYAMGMTFTF